MNVNPGVQHIQQCTVVSKLKIKTRHFHEVLYNVLGRLITNDLQSNQHRWLLFVWRSWIHDSLLPLEAPTLRWGSHEMTTDTYLRCWYLRRSVLMSISVSSSRPFMSIHSIPSNLLWGLGPPSSGKTNEVSKLSSGSGLSVPSLGGGTAFPREGIFDLRKKLHLLDFFVFDSDTQQPGTWVRRPIDCWYTRYVQFLEMKFLLWFTLNCWHSDKAYMQFKGWTIDTGIILFWTTTCS